MLKPARPTLAHLGAGLAALSLGATVLLCAGAPASASAKTAPGKNVKTSTSASPAPTPTSTSPAPSPTSTAPSPTSTAPSPTSTSPAPSSAPWVSGVYPGDGINAAAADRFGSYRGRAVGLATVFTDRSSWSAFSTDMWCVQQYQGWSGRLSIGVPLTLGSTTLAQVAAGAGDSYFTTYARNLASLGRGNSDLRLGWEFNGNWMGWSAYDPTSFKAAFRHVAQLLKSILPTATIDYNGNWGTSQSGHDPFTETYPGDDVVDVIGLDAYDGGWVPARTATEFASWAASDHSLNAWYAFAVQHGKKFSVPEWGEMASGSDGDNPAFIDGMAGFFRAHAADIAYEAYFNDTSAALYTSTGVSSLVNSYAAYRTDYSTV